jgi:uncharacterized membrane protein
MRKDFAEKLDSIGGKQLMKVLWCIFAVAIALVGAALFTYLRQFHAGFSTSQDVWGQFGSFLGGTLSPILSFLSLLALIFTVLLQARQLEIAREELQNSKTESEAMREAAQLELKQMREAADEQARQFREEMTKTELFDMIKSVHSELDHCFEAKADFSASGKTFGYYFSNSAPSVGYSQIPINGVAVSENDRVVLADLCELILELNGYLAQYEAEFRASARTYFYKKRYLTAADRMVHNGFILKEMLPAFQSVGYGWTAAVP